jgi:hypothetical protein
MILKNILYDIFREFDNMKHCLRSLFRAEACSFKNETKEAINSQLDNPFSDCRESEAPYTTHSGALDNTSSQVTPSDIPHSSQSEALYTTHSGALDNTPSQVPSDIPHSSQSGAFNGTPYGMFTIFAITVSMIVVY